MVISKHTKEYARIARGWLMRLIISMARSRESHAYMQTSRWMDIGFGILLSFNYCMINSKEKTIEIILMFEICLIKITYWFIANVLQINIFSNLLNINSFIHTFIISQNLCTWKAQACTCARRVLPSILVSLLSYHSLSLLYFQKI